MAWVLSWCDENDVWHKENWRYNSQQAALNWYDLILQRADDNIQGAVIEQVPNYESGNIVKPTWGQHPHKREETNEYVDTRTNLWCLMPQDPWNWKPADWQRGMRIRERARKKYKQGPQ